MSGGLEALPVMRPSSCPAPGAVPAFDAGWLAHELGMARETVAVLSAGPRWALLGYDVRAAVVAARAATAP